MLTNIVPLRGIQLFSMKAILNVPGALGLAQ